MALVIARIWRAEERKRAKRAQDHEYVNGEKVFSSSSSAAGECTEVEYVTEQYTAPSSFVMPSIRERTQLKSVDVMLDTQTIPRDRPRSPDSI